MEITAVEPRRKGLVQLYLDGEPAVKLDRETFLVSGLGPGDQLDDTQLRQLIRASDARRAKERPCIFWGIGATLKRSSLKRSPEQRLAERQPRPRQTGWKSWG